MSEPQHPGKQFPPPVWPGSALPRAAAGFGAPTPGVPGPPAAFPQPPAPTRPLGFWQARHTATQAGTRRLRQAHAQPCGRGRRILETQRKLAQVSGSGRLGRSAPDSQGTEPPRRTALTLPGPSELPGNFCARVIWELGPDWRLRLFPPSASLEPAFTMSLHGASSESSVCFLTF